MFKTLHSEVMALLTATGIDVDHIASDRPLFGPWAIAIKHDPSLRILYAEGRASWLALQAAIPCSFSTGTEWKLLWSSYSPAEHKAERVVDEVRHWRARDLRSEAQTWEQ